MNRIKKIILYTLIVIMLIPLNIYADSISQSYSEKAQKLEGMSLEEIIEECNKCLKRYYETIDFAAGFNVDKSVYEEYYTKVYSEAIERFSKITDLANLSDETFHEYYNLIKEISNKLSSGTKLTSVKAKFETENMMRYGAGNIKTYIDNKIEQDYNDNSKIDNEDKYFNGLSNEMILAWYDKRDELDNFSVVRLKEELARRGLSRYIDTYDFEDVQTDEDLEFWKPTSTGGNTKLESIAQKGLGIIQVFGSISSVIALVIIGIKYMLASVEEKAKYKETMIPYIVGCILVFATSNIASILYKIGMDIG